MKNANDGTNVRKKPGDISKHPAMIELKKLVAQLPANRQKALDGYLGEGTDDAISLLVEAREAITEGINLMIMACLDGYMPQSWEPLIKRIDAFVAKAALDDDDES